MVLALSSLSIGTANALESSFDCIAGFNVTEQSWQWQELWNASWPGTRLDDLSAVRHWNDRVGELSFHVRGRSICRSKNVLLLNRSGRATGSLKDEAAEVMAKLKEQRNALEPGPGVKELRLRNHYFYVPPLKTAPQLGDDLEHSGETIFLVGMKEKTTNIAHSAQALFWAYSLSRCPPETEDCPRIDAIVYRHGVQWGSWATSFALNLLIPIEPYDKYVARSGPKLIDVLTSPQNPGQPMSLPEEWFIRTEYAAELRDAIAGAQLPLAYYPR